MNLLAQQVKAPGGGVQQQTDRQTEF